MKKIRLFIFGILLLVVGYVIWGNSYQSQASEVFSTEEVEQIEIYTKEWDVQVEQTKSKKIKVVAEGLGKNKTVEASMNGNTLLVDQKKSEGGLFGGFSFKNNKKIKVMLPTSYSKKVNVKTKSGDVHLNKMPIGNMNVSSDSGDIYLKNITNIISRKAIIKTNNGDIDLSFSDDPTNLKLNTTSNEVDNNLGRDEFGKGENQLDLICPRGAISIY